MALGAVEEVRLDPCLLAIISISLHLGHLSASAVQPRQGPEGRRGHKEFSSQTWDGVL